MRTRQLDFLQALKVKGRPDHGGSLNQGKRKIARPFSRKNPLHVVLRSSKARGAWSMLHPDHAGRIDAEITRIAQKKGVRVYRRVNVGNHIHLLILSPNRPALRAFLRGLTGAIALIVTGAKKGKQALNATRFWDFIPYSRIVTWGREFETIVRYFVKNMFEAAGLWNRKRDLHLKLMWYSLEAAGFTPV